MSNEIKGPVWDLISAVHAAGCEQQVYQYFSNWMVEHSCNTELENIKLKTSLSLIKDYNDAKWHIKVIDNLTQID